MSFKEIMFAIVALIVATAVGIFVYIKKGPHPHSTSEDMDQQVIDQLVQHGSDPDKDHLIELAFFGAWPDMNKVRDALVAKGYKQILGQSDEMLVMGTYRKLDLAEIKAEVRAMETIAAQNNVEFDGWSAEIVK